MDTRLSWCEPVIARWSEPEIFARACVLLFPLSAINEDHSQLGGSDAARLAFPREMSLPPITTTCECSIGARLSGSSPQSDIPRCHQEHRDGDNVSLKPETYSKPIWNLFHHSGTYIGLLHLPERGTSPLRLFLEAQQPPFHRFRRLFAIPLFSAGVPHVS